jgi:signal transduction histidine kinase
MDHLAEIARLAESGFTGEEDTIGRVAALTQRLLQIDIVIVSEITGDGRYVLRGLEAVPAMPVAAGDDMPYVVSLCSRIHAGEAEQRTTDTRDNPALNASWQVLKAAMDVEWDIRAFMTVDVPLPDGQRFGTLCVHHTEPRAFTDMERDVLALLARLVGDEVARARAEARRAELVDEIAHELRAPLMVIDGYAEAMLDGVIERDDEHVVLLRREAGRSLRLLDDLALLTRLELDDAPEPADDVDVAALLQETRERLAPLAEAAGLRLVVDAAPVLVRAPRRRLEQALANLVRNALRALGDADGEIALACRAEDGAAVIEVADDGPGIPPDDLPHVFDRFYRGSAARDAGPGSGLGLTITRQIVERCGGSIAAEARSPHGTCFRIRLPLPPT